MNTASLLPPQSDLEAPHDPLLAATLKLERCARLLDLEDWVVERLRHCEQETVVNFLLTEDKGQAHSVTGIFARHCSAAGSVAVPFQVSRESYRNSVCAEAMRMTWLCALYGVHHGGGAAALIVNPQRHSERELYRAVSGFAVSARDALGSAGLLIPSGVHAVEMDWLDTGQEHGSGARPVITGKASSQSAESRREELATGIAELIRCAAGNLKQSVAVQGFDDDIRTLLLYLQKKGSRIVAVADSSGGLRHELGLDPMQLDEHVRNQAVLLGYPDGEAILNADVIEAECDVLILAGGDRQIHMQNASRVAARVIVEVMPGAVTESAAQELADAGKVLISNLLSAGPSLLRAAAEAEQIGSGSRRGAWVRRMVRDTWRSVADSARAWGVPVSQAAQALAIQRVAAALRAQGVPF